VPKAQAIGIHGALFCGLYHKRQPVVQVSQLGQNQILFGGAFQSPQRVGRSGDEPPAENLLDKLSPPAWREDEVSVECDAARVRVDWRDLNLFVIRETKGQPDIDRELPHGAHVEHVESDAQYASAKDEMIACAHWARGAFHQPGPGPLRQLARVREQVPNALGGGEEDFSRTDFHRSVSLTPYYTVRMAMGERKRPAVSHAGRHDGFSDGCIRNSQ
jgi:hypothetical protein